SVEQHPAAVGGVDPGEDLDQGALAGSVLAEQSVDLSRADLQIRTVEGEDAVEVLADGLRLEDMVVGVLQGGMAPILCVRAAGGQWAWDRASAPASGVVRRAVSPVRSKREWMSSRAEPVSW